MTKVPTSLHIRCRAPAIRKPLESLSNAQWLEQFHVWRMLWDERLIRLSVDDVCMNAQVTDLDCRILRSSCAAQSGKGLP